MSRIRALIVDDSALMRQLLEQLLSQDPEIEVVGTAGDPFIAREKIKKLNPDVLTLDVEMPRMDGLTFLEKLMAARPMPVVMVSSLTEKSCETTLRALELGAVDFVTKPKIDITTGVVELGSEIVEKVKVAARAKVHRLTRQTPSADGMDRLRRASNAMIQTTDKVICIGASTGGTEAILEVLTRFPADAPGTVVVLHMPAGFTKSFAHRLDGLCQVRVSEAKDGDRIMPGHVLLAPGGFHMSVQRTGAVYNARVHGGEPVNRHKPSVDVLFQSAAHHMGANAVAAILTGMGNDGAKGLLSMRQAGSYTVAQNEASCVVFGMPREAIVLGAACETLPLPAIADSLLRPPKILAPLPTIDLHFNSAARSASPLPR